MAADSRDSSNDKLIAQDGGTPVKEKLSARDIKAAIISSAAILFFCESFKHENYSFVNSVLFVLALLAGKETPLTALSRTDRLPCRCVLLIVIPHVGTTVPLPGV